MAASSDPLREQLIRLLTWEEAHVGFEKAFAGIPPEQRGARPAGAEHSLWQLLEHLRLAQKDLLSFAADRDYVHTMKWPDDYWPADPAPPNAKAWDESLADFRADRDRLEKFVRDQSVDLFALVPTGKGQQTNMRAILLVADHNAYHLGEAVLVRRELGLWP